MMFKNSNYALIDISNLKSFGDIFYYLYLFIFLPIVCFILFSSPIYYSFSNKKLDIFILINVGVLISEYVVYTYFASQSNWYNGIFNTIISVICFALMFKNEIKLIAKK